jgi:hypothetical protein
VAQGGGDWADVRHRRGSALEIGLLTTFDTSPLSSEVQTVPSQHARFNIGLVTWCFLTYVPLNLVLKGDSMCDSEVLNVLQRDLHKPFLASLQDALRGEYSKAYEDVVRPPGGFAMARPNSEWDRVDLQTVRKFRRSNGMRALMHSCNEHGAPIQIKTLACNGQKIVVGQMGQLLILIEPIDNLSARPEHAAYRVDLAASHFAIRQLEMDLGDGWRQRIDVRNTMLVIIQHGMRIGGLNRRDTALEIMRLVVPDASCGSWLLQANVLSGELGALLDWTTAVNEQPTRPSQEDRVFVTLKRNLGEKDIER